MRWPRCGAVVEVVPVPPTQVLGGPSTAILCGRRLFHLGGHVPAVADMDRWAEVRVGRLRDENP